MRLIILKLKNEDYNLNQNQLDYSIQLIKKMKQKPILPNQFKNPLA